MLFRGGRRFLSGFLCGAMVAVATISSFAQDADVDTPTPAAATSGLSGTAAFERAEVAFRENQLDDALQLYKEALKSQPSNARIRARIAEIEKIQRSAPIGNQPGAADAGANDAEALARTSTGKSGATKYTENMPMDVKGLVALRQQHLNKPEMRAAWVTRFNWCSPNPAQAQAQIIDTMEKAKALNLNAVMFQVRSEATTMYPSKLEPWSRLLGGADPGFDPLKMAIAEAHKRGIEFHAYINPCPVSDERNGPTDPQHLWQKHCIPTANPNWLVFQGGKPAEFNEYWWLNMNLPEVQTHVRQVVVDLVTRYDVDGIHYDRIRFPSSGVSDDPWSKARYAGEGNPMKLEYNEWQRQNLIRMLTDIYGSISAIRPKTKVSAAVWGIYDKSKLPQGAGPADRANSYAWASSGLQDYHQDSMGMINGGALDALVPMTYWDMGGIKPDYDELIAWFKDNIKNGRHVYGGQKVFSKAEMLRQVVATNLIGAHGTCPFTLEEIFKDGLANFYKKNIFPNKVATPPMEWKTAPKTGLVLVQVKNAQGAPVMDAHVKLASREYVYLSSADGFCAILDAPPGPGQLSVVKKGVGSANASIAAIIPGKPAAIELVVK